MIKKINKNQKNILIAIPGADTFPISVSSAGEFFGLTKAIINSEKIKVTKKRVNQDIPHHTGPNGVIQSCPDQPTKKIIRKKSKNPRHGPRLLTNTNNKVRTNETIKALEIIYNPFIT